MSADTQVVRSPRVALSSRPSRTGDAAGTARPPADPTPSPIEDVRDRLASEAPQLPVADLLDRLVRVGGTVIEGLAVQQLTRAERLAVAVLSDGSVDLTGPEAAPRSGKVVFKGAIGYTTAHKPYVDVPGLRPVSRTVPVLPPVAVLSWTAAQVETFLARRGEVSAAAAGEVRSAREHLASLERDGGLAAAVLRMRSILPHVAPVSTFVGQRNLTNLRSPRNLTGQSHLEVNERCVLHGLEHVQLQAWPDDAAIFLSLADRVTRRWGRGAVEYLNGIQLEHSVLAGDDATGTGGLRYRRIDGVLRNKRIHRLEDAAARPDVAARLDDVVAAVAPAATAMGLHHPDALGLTADQRTATFAELVEGVLRAGRELTASELAMSRGMRDLPLLAGAVRTGDRTGLAGCAMDDQYCCVVGEPGTRGPEVADRMWAIGSRMRYNSWHFRPWTGVEPALPDVRETYFAPEVPDLTTHADFHHPGHINYRVRHAIRVPRAVTLDETQFVGLIDVRLSRSEDEPYATADMLSAVAVADRIAAAYEGLLRAELAGQGPHVVQTFDLDWFRERYL